MLTGQQILACFNDLNEELRREGNKGEICIVGGAVMCLVFNARKATRDVDAVFEPSQLLRRLAAKIAKRHGLANDWLNDGAKGYLVTNFAKQKIASFSNLDIWAPEARYMLAMKCISARWDSSDKDDVIFLIKHLKYRKATEVFKVIESYYPKKQIPAKTQFLIEELFES